MDSRKSPALLRTVLRWAASVPARVRAGLRRMAAGHRERTSLQRTLFAFVLLAALAGAGLSTGWALWDRLASFDGGSGGHTGPSLTGEGGSPLLHGDVGQLTLDNQVTERSPLVAAPRPDSEGLADRAVGSQQDGMSLTAAAPQRSLPEPEAPRGAETDPTGQAFHPKVDALPPDAFPPAATASSPAQSEVLPTVSVSEMVWPVAGSVVRPFGWYRHPVFGDWRHASSTALVPDGDDRSVRAVLAGRVRDVVNEGGVWRVTLEHAGGLLSEYEGLESVQVHSYAVVATGAVLGVAPTRESGRHVAFALYSDGAAVDPQTYLPAGAVPVRAP